MLHRVRLVAHEDAGVLEAIQEAALLDPEVPLYLFGLTVELHFAGTPDEALAAADRFVDLAPFEPLAHSVRAMVLMKRRDLDGAVSESEAAIRLVGRGLDLAPWGITSVGVLDQATGTYRYHYVPGWDPNLGPLRGMLATARLWMGDPDGALAALDVVPGDALVARYLDWIRQRILVVQGRVDDALPVLQVLAEDPVATGELRYHLGMLYLAKGDFVRGRELLLAFPERATWVAGWRYPAAEWAKDVETLLALARDLPSAAAPEDRVGDAREGILLGLMLQAHGRHRASMRAFETAFEADPEAAGRLLPWAAPYPAAAAAAQSALFAAWGLGRDAEALGDAERAACRERALAWMRSALESLRRLAHEDPTNGPGWLRGSLGTWLEQGDFALGREEANLRRLPPEEAAAWRALWEEVRRETD
jgi:tetratricopeptide (TPR) repeat protein